jgi:hypothetical protein
MPGFEKSEFQVLIMSEIKIAARRSVIMNPSIKVHKNSLITIGHKTHERTGGR